MVGKANLAVTVKSKGEKQIKEAYAKIKAETVKREIIGRQGGRDEQQEAAQVQRMLRAWEQQTAQDRAAILAETRQRIEQQEQSRRQQSQERSRGPSMDMGR